jgi:hypothetical protein
VQGTILMPANPSVGEAPSAPPAVVSAPKKKYEEKELPAVPIQSNKR